MQIHLWALNLAESATEFQAQEKLLSDDEVLRVGNMKFERDRQRWIVGRAMLRSVLSHYIAVPPEEIRFKLGDHGKPALIQYHGPMDNGAARIHFNLAHSHELALLALTDIGPVGVDVEWVKEISDMEAVVRRFFSRPEREIFDGLSNEQRVAGFYACWTRKEAYLKALGCGLLRPTDSFDVEFRPAHAPAIVAIEGSTRLAANWMLLDLMPAAGYRAALAIETTRPVDIRWCGINQLGSEGLSFD